MVFHSPRPPGKGGGIDATSGQGNHVSIAPHGKSIPTNGGSNPPSPTLAEAEDQPRCEHGEITDHLYPGPYTPLHCLGPKREAGEA